MKLVSVALLIASLLFGQDPALGFAQQTSQQQTTQSTQSQTGPVEGGPTGDNGPIAIPKKPAASTPPPPPPPAPKVKNPPGLGNLSLHVNVPVVTVDVGVVLEKTHQFVPNLKEDNFRVFENGKPQEITHFQRIQAPITAVLLLEFASTSWWFISDMENAAYAFTQQLRPNDYVAVVTYDMHTNILTDFTNNRAVVMNALRSLTIPTWSETNIFDALYTTLDRLSRIPGRKYIILIGSGVDTFSKITLGKCLEKVKETPNVTIFTISTGQMARLMADDRGFGMSGPREMTFLQADNQMQTFARLTGGMSFFPRFQAELPEDFSVINASIRNQYAITYTPTDQKEDGTWRKIHVELVDDEGHPLRMQDEKHHQLKYDIIARDGYRAKQEVN
ncbi:MAG TPA: VWA domain-containing protein [Acidobacteriaceae bacterium]|nr:VWA domain-containing protein [Acidobacteriaceae bacterium]